MKVLDWLADMIGLPEQFKFSGPGRGGGVIQGTASESTLVALLAARSRTLDQLRAASCAAAEAEATPVRDLNNNKEQELQSGGEPDQFGQQSCAIERLVGYCSDLAHSSVERAGLLGGIRVVGIESDDESRMRGAALRRQLIEDRARGLVPFLVVASIGTTSVCSYDDLHELGLVCREFGLWLHVDAAYAGSAFVCPEFRRLMRGIELADSFVFNPHKWLQVTFDCSLFYLRDSRLLVDAFNVDPLYLKHENQGKIPDYRVSFLFHLSSPVCFQPLTNNNLHRIISVSSIGKSRSAGKFRRRPPICCWSLQPRSLSGANISSRNVVARQLVRPNFQLNQVLTMGNKIFAHAPTYRRFRSLKLWFVVRATGVAGLQEYIRNVSIHSS